jgi:predicted nucleic acid-binding protein
VNAQELLVHDRGEWQRAERFDARVVYTLGVLVLALELKRKIICQVPALVISAEEEERVRVPNLERP